MSLTSPTSKDGFYYAGDSLYVEASGHNRHRRATLPELHALFHVHPANAADVPKDPVGHWYEAQLLHYGLPPSKNKAVAKTRLLDAVNTGNLAVPAHIQQLESELKKAWTKKERQAKAELKKKNKNDEPALRGEKRKAENCSASPLTRKSKPDSSKSATNAGDTSSPKPKRLKLTARCGGSFVGPSPSTLSSTDNVPKQTATRGVGGIKKEDATPATGRLKVEHGRISATGRGGAVMARGGATGATTSFAHTASQGGMSTDLGRIPPTKDDLMLTIQISTEVYITTILSHQPLTAVSVSSTAAMNSIAPTSCNGQNTMTTNSR